MIRLRKMLPWWIPWTRVGNACNSLHSAARMRAILDRERMRSDRGNSTFAVLTLNFSKQREELDLPTLAQIFRDRLRATDDAGLLGSRHIAVVLPETPAEGAWKVSKDICDLLPAEMRRPECDVYVYPANPPEGGIGTAVEVDQAQESRGVQPMEVLFAQPLPVWKRMIDVIGAATLLMLAAPLIVLVALTIKATSRGPIIFAQRRDTISGRPFLMYKFRTMSADAELKKAALLPYSDQDGPAFKIAEDPRVTAFGRWLRVTSIDELPQLVNVLKGEMSLVGPRALPCDESNRCEPWQRRRLDVTAGLTCIWQVRGRSAVAFAEWMRMDLRYVNTRSLANDLKLISQTVPAVVLRRGAC